jgi:hypothetical protein
MMKDQRKAHVKQSEHKLHTSYINIQQHTIEAYCTSYTDKQLPKSKQKSIDRYTTTVKQWIVSIPGAVN